jgi:hypothetical protein
MSDFDIEKELDIDKVISESTRKVKSEDLARKFKTVNVLRQDQLNDMIKKAIEIVLSRRDNKLAAEGVADAARREYFEETKKELKLLIKQRQDLEIEMAREKAAFDASKETYQRMKGDYEDLKKQAQAEKEKNEAELAKLRNETATLSATLVAERKVHEETVRQKAEEADRLKSMLARFVNEYPEHKGNAEMEALRNEIRAMSSRDSSLAEQIRSLVGEMTTQIREDLAGKLVAAGSGGRGGPVEAKEVILDALFKDQPGIDSNIDKLKVTEKKSAGVSDALKKLKDMRKPQ